MAKRGGLGKGLDALFFDNNTEDGSIATLKIGEIEPNKNQPRTLFNEEALRELADSIKQHGVLQPLVVRPQERGGYQIVAGERRWRAARMAGLAELPAVIRELDDDAALQIALIENLQREDLNPIELARGYQTLIDRHNLTQEQVAEKVGKSRSTVSNTIRLLTLPEAVQQDVSAGKIPRGHAKALLELKEPALIEQMAQRVKNNSVLVRDIEKLARDTKEDSHTEAEKEAIRKDLEEDKKVEDSVKNFLKSVGWGRGANYYREAALSLEALLGRRVKITTKKEGSTIGGIIEIEFYNKEDLLTLLNNLADGGYPPPGVPERNSWSDTEKYK